MVRKSTDCNRSFVKLEKVGDVPTKVLVVESSTLLQNFEVVAGSVAVVDRDFVVSFVVVDESCAVVVLDSLLSFAVVVQSCAAAFALAVPTIVVVVVVANILFVNVACVVHEVVRNN